MRRVLLIGGLALAACSPAPDGSTTTPSSMETPAAPGASAPPVAAPTPSAPKIPPPGAEVPPTRQGVIVRADPPPPFTYWAPEGSVIRNHGNPGLWVAFVDGRQVKTYFGDDCGASRMQGWIGRLVSDVPAPPPAVAQRITAMGDPVTDDLQPNRINVLYDRASGQVREIACY